MCDGHGKGQAVDAHGAHQNQIAAYVKEHIDHAEIEGRLRVFQTVKDPVLHIVYGNGHEGQGVEAEADRRGVGVGLGEYPPHKGQLHNGLSQNDEPGHGGNGDEEHGAHGTVHDPLALFHFSFVEGLAHGGIDDRGYGRDKDPDDQHVQLVGVVQTAHGAGGEARGQGPVDQGVDVVDADRNNGGNSQKQGLLRVLVF